MLRQWRIILEWCLSLVVVHLRLVWVAHRSLLVVHLRLRLVWRAIRLVKEASHRRLLVVEVRSIDFLRRSKVRLLHVTRMHLLRLSVILRLGRETIERDIRGFPLRVTGAGHFPCRRVLSLTLPHTQLASPLLPNFQNKRRPGDGVTHQVLQCGLRLTNQVIVTVVVIVKDC